MMLLSYVGPAPRSLGAVLGGVGFGLFIDELGKFVTADNDYFYAPIHPERAPRPHGARTRAPCWASTLSSAALNACSCVIAVSVRSRQSRMSWPKKG